MNMKYSFQKIFLWFTIATCVALFTIPFMFPQNEVVQSLSYEMGFNNLIGILLLVIASFIMFIYGVFCCKDEQLSFDLSKVELGSRKLLHILEIVSFFILFLLALLFWGVEDGVLQGYWPIHYSDAMKAGWVMYEDIHVIYGLLQILPLHWLRLLGIPAMTAQLFIVSISAVLCLRFVYDILGYIVIPVKEKNAVLILSSILFFPYYMGIEGFRYVYTTWLLLKLMEMSKKNVSILLQALAVVCAVFFSVLFSQEYGLCLSFVLVVFYFLNVFIVKHWKELILVFAVIFSLVALIVWKPGMFNAVLYMAGGASNFPYVPSFHLIVLFASVLLFVWMIGTQINNIKEKYNILVLELLLLSYLPSVLGRCNPSHVLPIAFFIIIVSGVHFVKMYNKRLVMVLYILAFLTPFPFIIKTQGMSILRPVIANVAHHNKWAVKLYVDKQLPGYNKLVERMTKAEKRKIAKQEFLDVINKTSTIMSFCSDESLYVYLNENCIYKENFFGQSLSWLANEEQFSEVINTLVEEKPDFLVMPKGFREKWLFYSERDIINLWFCTYCIAKPYRSYNEALYRPLVSLIDENYLLINQFEGLELYGRR